MEQFNWQAKEWDNDPDKVKRAEVFASEIEGFLKPDKTLTALEFGCGTGLLSFNLKNAFKHITLVDSSEGMISVLKNKIADAKIDNFTPVHANILESSFNSKKYDVIYNLMTLHHIVNVEHAIETFSNLLNNSGYLCIADLVSEDGSFHAHVPNFDGHNGFDKDELAKLMESKGLKVLHYKICYEIIKNTENGGLRYPIFLMICQKK